VQAVEAAALFALFAWLQRLHRQGRLRDRRLFAFFLVYGLLRFVLEFLREPIAASILGLGFYQWLALLLAGIGGWQLAKRSRAAAAAETA
jgi:prolipoprotein diacylglyceryltransferase